MESVLRAAAIYLVLLVIFRIAGRRALSEITTFDFVMLLIIGEATQQALLGEDFSITNAALVIVSLIAIDVMISLLERRSPKLARMINGEPIIIVEHGKVLRQRLYKSRVEEADILEAARHSQGLERIDQIKFAVLERNGSISIIPKEQS